MDRFVVECRRRVALETLQEDLNIYLKTLQSAMIELINKDYADFVNLSTNLVSILSYLPCPTCTELLSTVVGRDRRIEPPTRVSVSGFQAVTSAKYRGIRAIWDRGNSLK